MRGYNSSLTPRPRQPNTPVVSQALTGVKVPLPNPYTPPIPSVAFDKTGQVRNIAACVTALKAGVESLTGQRGDLSNRAVTFKDLVDFGVLSQNAVGSSSGVSTGGGGGAGLPGPPGPPGPPGTASIFVGDIPPPMTNGAAWFDAIGAQLYIGYQDANSTQWVPVANQPGPQGPPGTGSGPPGPPGVSIITADVAPSPTNGGAWWNSAEGQLYVGYQDANSTQWVRATNVEPGPPGPQGPPGTASSLITSVNAGNGLTGGGSAGDLLLSLFTPVSVANGGTGSTTASGALTNLGAASVASLGNYLPLTGGTLTGGFSVLNSGIYVGNSTLNVGVIVQNAGGPALWLFDDGNSHLESSTHLWFNGNSGTPVTSGGAFHAPTVTATSGVYIDNNNCYYWIGSRAIIGSDGGTVYIQDNTGGFNTIQFTANNNYYDQTAHHFRNRSYYEAMSLYPQGSDPLHVNCPSGGHARIWYNDDGVRAWTAGAVNSGGFWIADESAGAVRFSIDTAGNVDCRGNPMYAGYLSSSGSIYSAGNYYTPSNIWAERGLHCKQGWYGGWSGNDFNTFWDGNIQCWVDSTYAGSIQMQSDYRIKKDVAPLPSTWERIKALHPISYTHRDFTPPVEIEERVKRGEPPRSEPFFPGDDIERWGFFAHELQETLTTSAATGVKDAYDTIQSPNSFTLLAALTRALQEAMTRIEVLEAVLS